MRQVEGFALRVGLVGSADPPALAAALTALAAVLPPSPGAPPLLRLLHAEPAAIGLPAGWTDCPLTEAAGTDVTALIADNVDLLLAAGDPMGALAAPVVAALTLGAPVVCLASGPVRLLTDRHWNVSTRPLAAGDEAWSALGLRLASLLAPPSGPPPAASRLIEAGFRPQRRWIWGAHRAVLNVVARGPAGSGAVDPPLQWWAALFEPADALANAYADRYRSSYTIVLGLAALALLVGVTGLRIEWHWPVAIGEALCLAGILAVVWANARLDWRSRLIQCRLLAELCRKQAALAHLGRSLPAAGIAGLAHEAGLDWIGWRFAAAVRAAPLPTGTLSGAALAAARDAAAAILLRGQGAYHEARARLGRRREATLVRAGEAVFGLTVLLVAAKLALLLSHHDDGAEDAGLAAALLPAIAAALFGFRAYAELELMVQQSEHLVAVLADAEAALDRIDPAAPGAAHAIADVFSDTAAAMLADVAGWIQISRVKAVETG